MTTRKFIIDCDVGLDDAQAIMMALSCNDIEVLAITTVFGNTDIKFTTRNTLRVLKVVDRLDVPVYKGCNQSILGEQNDFHYHGKDGLGDCGDKYPPPEDVSFQKKHAALAIIDLLNNYPGEITLVCLGPLTNIATALMLDHNLGAKLKRCYIMGGNTEGRGNVAISQEFNFYSDQEAAHATLNNLKCPITIIPLELCVANSFSWQWFDQFISSPTPLAAFIRVVGKYTIEKVRKTFDKYINIWDELAMAIAIDENVILDSIDVYASVELHGSLTRGQMVIDWNNNLEKSPNVTIPQKINQELFSKLLYRAIGVTSNSPHIG